MPRLCVVIPCFNNAATVGKTLESLSRSTFDDWIAVVTDNGSQDGSADIVAPYQGSRVILHRHDQAISKTPNWNRAYRDVPDCEYLVTLHADDLIAPDALRKIAELARHRPALIHGRHDAIDEAGRPMRHRGFPFDYAARGAEFRRLLLLGNIVAVPAATIRRDLFDVVGGWSDQWFMQDLEMWWQLSFRGSVLYSGQKLGTYRLLDDRKPGLYVSEYGRWSLQRLEDCRAAPAMRAAVLANLALLRAGALASADPASMRALADIGLDDMALPSIRGWANPLARQRLLRLGLAARTRLTGMHPVK